MLTAELLRFKDDGKSVEPRTIDLDPRARGREKILGRARGLVTLFEQHVGRTRGELDEAIADFVGDGTDYLITRGLTKLLQDRSEFETTAVVDPEWLRERLFTLAVAHHPIVRTPDAVHRYDRAAFLALAAERLQAERPPAPEGSPPAPPLTAEGIEASLYADLEENQVLRRFEGLSGEELLERYNLAQAQGILYRASVLNVRLLGGPPHQHRQLMRFMKFCRLMHSVRSRGDGVWDIVIDGPLSLFSNTQKYGLQMAVFLPALLHCEAWELEAELSWGPQREARTFRLDHRCGLKSHYRQSGQYVTEEQAYFEDRFAELESPWELSREAELIDLGGRDVCVPDLVFRHREDGRVALMEIVGFWRRAWLEKKASLLAQHGPPNLILAVSDRLKTDQSKKSVEDLGEVRTYGFKGVILAKRVLELVEEVAVVPAAVARGRRRR